MKKIFLISGLLSTLFCTAQKFTADEVLNAEKAFAAYSVAHGTRDAFLNFLDSSGLVFENGKAVNGIRSWSKKEARAGVLNWHPVYGAISSSGDVGFTTGPWTFQKTLNDSVIARGQYSTIWQKNKKGEWKFIIDMGVGKTPSFDDAIFSFSDDRLTFIPGTLNNLLLQDEKLIRYTKDATTPERKKWYESAVSKQAFFLNRPGHLPATNSNDVMGVMESMPQKIDYEIDGSGISKTGDMGYVYGTTIIKDKTDNYLRIWRREGSAWKLALEVLQY